MELIDRQTPADSTENGRPARLHLLHADTGTRVNVDMAPEALTDDTRDVRLVVERVEDGQALDEAEAAWPLPVRAGIRLVETVWTDGVEALETVAVDGACELTMSVYAYAGSPVLVECLMADGSRESCECIVNEDGDVTLQLSSVPTSVEIRLKDAH